MAKEIKHNPSPLDIVVLENKIRMWHKDRNLIDKSTDQLQMVKLIEEVGELARAVSLQHKMITRVNFYFAMLLVIYWLC